MFERSKIRRLRGSIPVVLLLFGLAACSTSSNWDAEEWNVAATVEEDSFLITATIADIHGDFVHMSIRRDGHINGYTEERSPASGQPERDWTRVHHWFGELHGDTYLEGRIDDGSGEGPSDFESYTFRLPTGVDSPRQNFADEDGSDYEYITIGYNYADGSARHPTFDAGEYTIEIYAWYTGGSGGDHPSTGDHPGVQYIHYEQPLTSTQFTID